MHIRTANTILYCKKWAETVAFYENRLRLPRTSSTDWFVEFKLNELARLSVANETRASIKSADGKGITLSLEVIDLEATRSEFAEAGLEPTAIREIWGSTAFYLFDPEGHRLEFWSGNATA